MPKKKQSLEELAVLTNEKPLVPVEDDTDDEIVAPKIEPVIAVIKKERKPKTQAQIDAFKRTRQKGIDINEKRRIEKEATAKMEQEILESKIVKKALKIKRREIKQQAVLETSDEDEEPIQAVKKVATKRVRIQEPEKQYEPPTHNFFFV